MGAKIGWINGCWDTIKNLNIPIDDRGLNFGDGIFETILISENQPKLLKAHLDRWQKNAIKLNMAAPPSEKILKPIINEGLESSILENGTGSLRLNWSRGSNNNRGIDFKNDADSTQYRFWIEITSMYPSFEAVTTKIDAFERRNANSIISQCKTFNYLQSIQAKSMALKENFNDALLLSTTGEMCCGTTANILIERNSKILTPRLKSGCLPGIMRQQGIKKGIFEERKISAIPEAKDKWLLINSLSCHPISKINNQTLTLFKDADRLWKTLLSE